MTDSFYDDPWGDDNTNSDEGKEEGYTEFCISPYGSKEATEKVWEERQRRRDKQEQERRNQGDPGAIPPRNLGSNRFGRGNRGRWNGPNRDN